MSRRKPYITVTISNELLEWIDKKIKDKTFADRSHAVEHCVHRIKEIDESQS